MSTIERLEAYLKAVEKTPQGTKSYKLPEIRYFDGIEMFCCLDGSFKAFTLEESLDNFLKSKGF